jgi:hypothetical protein
LLHEFGKNPQGFRIFILVDHGSRSSIGHRRLPGHRTKFLSWRIAHQWRTSSQVDRHGAQDDPGTSLLKFVRQTLKIAGVNIHQLRPRSYQVT